MSNSVAGLRRVTMIYDDEENEKQNNVRKDLKERRSHYTFFLTIVSVSQCKSLALFGIEPVVLSKNWALFLV
jgi:hypothetical protein